MATRSRSRSPLNHDGPPGSGRGSPTPSHMSSNSNNSKKDWRKGKTIGKYYLRLVNLPIHWKWQNVSGYVKKHTIAIDKAISDDIAYISLKPGPTLFLQDCIITFKSEHRKNQAFESLKSTHEKIDGKKLYVTKINEGQPQKFAPQSNIPHIPKARSTLKKPQDASFFGDINESFGLSIEYLKELGISPPLTRKVFVRHLPLALSDEAKARALFGRAGTIASFELVPKSGHLNARIEYDHPVEAVQAVSMFNNRDIHGRTVHCVMDSIREWNGSGVVPGPGLGPNGTPMRGVRVAVEIKKLREDVMTECQRLNDSIEKLKSQVTSLINTTNQCEHNLAAQVQPVANPVTSTLANVANPLAALSTLLTGQLQPMQLLQSLVQQNTGNDLSAMGNTLQNWTAPNLGNMLQQAQTNNQLQGGINTQGGPNMQGAGNMQSGSNMQVGNILQAVSNMQGGPNIQSGSNNIQGGANNMQSGPNDLQRGHNNMASRPFNMLSNPALANNMQREPNNMQSGNFTGSKNMHGGPQNMHGGPQNMHSGPQNMHGGPQNMHGGPQNMHGGPQNMHGGPQNMHGGPQNMQGVPQNMPNNQNLGMQGQVNNPGFNMQSNQHERSNVQPGFSNMQSSGSVPIQQTHSGFGGSQFNNNTNIPDSTGSHSAMLLFINLPPTVTLPVLQGKMREVGEVKLAEMTGPGRALISFYSDFDAEKCIRLFNQSKVDGQTIEVRKV